MSNKKKQEKKTPVVKPTSSPKTTKQAEKTLAGVRAKYNALLKIQRNVSVSDHLIGTALDKLLIKVEKGKRSVRGSLVDAIIAGFSLALYNKANHKLTPQELDKLITDINAENFIKLGSKVIKLTYRADDVVNSARIATFVATGVTPLAVIVKDTYAPIVTKFMKDLILGKAKVTLIKGAAEWSASKLKTWVLRAPTQAHEPGYFLDKYIYYLPGFVIHD